MEHELKCEAEYFDAVKSGGKTFEIRKNDRGFSVGDTIVMRRTANGKPYPYDSNGVFHGPLHLVITYMTDFAQQPSYVVLGVQKTVETSTLAALRAQVEELAASEQRWHDCWHTEADRATRAEAERDSALDKFQAKVEECITARMERDEARERVEMYRWRDEVEALAPSWRLMHTSDNGQWEYVEIKRAARATLAECGEGE